MYFFLKNVWKLQKNSYLCNEFYAFGRDIRACPRVGGRLINIDGTRPPAICTASLERTFSNVTVCKIKLRNFESKYSGDATESVHVG